MTPPPPTTTPPRARLGAAIPAPLRRLPFPALALAVCLLFAALGIAVVDDYGATPDGQVQRNIAIQNATYIMGDRNPLHTGC